MLNFVLIANPQSPRVNFFQQALASLELPPAQLVTYEDLLAQRCSLQDYDRPDIWFRFESPERNFGCDRAFISAGADLDPSGPHHCISAGAAYHLPADKGRIFYPRQWYLGWQKLLREWAAPLQGKIMNHPDDIVVMFDKVQCQQRLAQAGIPVARWITDAKHDVSLTPIQNYDQLQSVMDETGCDRLFIKLAHGSAASGVVAYERYRGQERAITTVERTMEDDELRFYNSRKVFQYRNPNHIADIINFLAKERIQVEAWMPKARIEGREFDLRVVVIGGKACHVVVRLGRSPMTNLHLGSDRRSVEVLRDRLCPSDWETMMHTCERAAACFPKSLYCGVDLLITPNWKDHYVLEVNAFGDLVKGMTWQGKDTYTAELEVLMG
ncbi:MAG: hypothetical protein F6K09_14385 [Merismopedia sp. SIO2A8]|nr:hypothetical protein [Merismopedia sp. SIO2A8]